MKSAFLLSKGLLCLYDKQNNIWLLVDMEFLFSCFNYWNVPPTADGELIPNFRKQNPSYKV